MYKYLSLFFLLLLPLVMTAQTLTLELPDYAGRDYFFCLRRGTRQDTISNGVLDAKCGARVPLPKDYRGVGRFAVEEYAKIWNVVLNNGEKFTMSEPDKLEADPTFSGSVENSFLLDAIAGKKTNKEVNDSPLYAARIFEILNCLVSNNTSEQRQFIAEKLDFDDLYTSGFWQPTMELWYQLNMNNDSLLDSDSRHLLDKITDIPLRRELTQTIIRLFSKYGKDSLLLETV